jgi:SAM-dependent methyltransferase
MPVSEFVSSIDSLMVLLDGLVEKRLDPPWWDQFYADRRRPVPFFHDKPSEHLFRYFEDGRLQAGRALDLGCGNGRDSVFMASRGCRVDAVDFAAEPLAWGRELANSAGETVHFVQGSIFDVDLDANGYDLVNDSGCFHHLTPHRRISYLSLLRRVLKPGGTLVFCCLNPEIAPPKPDREVYESKDPGGERGYSIDEIRSIFEADFDLLELRPMQEQPPDRKLFGKSFCVVALMQIKG